MGPVSERMLIRWNSRKVRELILNDKLRQMISELYVKYQFCAKHQNITVPYDFINGNESLGKMTSTYRQIL